jgi:hypothetical protein
MAHRLSSSSARAFAGAASSFLLLILLGCASKAPLEPASSSTLRERLINFIGPRSIERPGDDAGGGAPGRNGRFIDLREGKVTEHRRLYRHRQILYDGTRGEWEEYWSYLERGVLRTEEIDSVEYRFEYESERQSADDPVSTEFGQYWRQDPTGVYFYQPHSPRLAAATDGVPARALDLRRAWADARSLPEANRAAIAAGLERIERARSLAGPSGGPFENEYILLRYPMRVGTTWSNGQTNVVTVEAIETFRLPTGSYPAVRIDVFVPWAQQEGEKNTYWYAEPGQVKSSFHYVGDPTDIFGNPIPQYEFEDVTEMTSYTPGRGPRT